MFIYLFNIKIIFKNNFKFSMGSCGSVKKPSDQISQNGKKTTIPSNMNGIAQIKRKSVRLQELDRISNATVLEGILVLI